jgi:hypothetical protein
MSTPIPEAPAPTPTPAPPAEGTPTPTPPTPEAPAQEPTDWKAEARKWETRAKENKSAAEKLAEFEESQKTEAQKLSDRAAAAEAKAAEYEKREQVAAWKADVSKETGVPAGALSGTTLEEIQAHAEILKPLITQAPTDNTPLAPHVPGEGAPPSGGVASQLNANDIASMTPDQINAARKAGRLNRLMGIS